jgi:NTE family protein
MAEINSKNQNPNSIQTPTEKYPRIGFALGGGAAKAVCQLAILKELQKNNIQLSYLMGSSMGAIIGGIYALGLDPDQTLKRAVEYNQKKKIFSLSNMNFLRESIFNIKFSKDYLINIFGDKTFADCKIPFAVTTVDLESGKAVLLDKGPLWEAILASTSIPGVFPPFFKDGLYLVDGGLLEETPLNSLRRAGNLDILLGCRIVDFNNNRLAISGAIYQKYYQQKYQHLIKSKEQNKLLNNVKKFYKNLASDAKLMFDVMMRSIDILRDELFHYQLAESKPDILMQIEVDDVSLFEFSDFNKLMEKGQKTIEKYLPEILKLVEQKKIMLNNSDKGVNLNPTETNG